MKNLTAFLHELYVRITSDTPRYFARLRVFCLSLLGLCVTLQPQMAILIEKLTDSGVVPQSWLSSLSGYVMAGAAVGALVSSLMVKDYAPIEKLKNETL